ncbi:SRPBCC family protein [Pedobacter psychroterrae]|uniref:Polyketide cyclase/dehydrase n=1 Tax=Pedobacter psychroterrae TaxID=2530453 RepID=A0A4R0NSN5_9SPHI|nr:SRPBCC family protein [Pedobacter psychroterrae]TCD03149.1 polyketide cyclase/dehydrase [Pedobacter psychroterrae]
MKRIIYFISLPVVCIAAVIIIMEYTIEYPTSGIINKDAPVLTRKSIIINADLEKIWTIMANVNHWDTWQSEIENPNLTGRFIAGNSFTWKTGGLNIRSTLHTAKPFDMIGWSGPAFGSFAVHNWTFIRLPNGSIEVKVEESMEGWLVSLLPGKFQKGLESSLEIWLKALKVVAEK